MNRRTVLIALCFPLLLAAGCGGGEVREDAALPPDAIVRVDGKVLTGSHLEILLPAGEKTPYSASEKAAWVRQWVEMELLYGEAVRRGLHNDPRIKARLESLEMEYLADHLTFIELRERIEVSEGEIEEYFEEHRDQYVHEYRVSHIMLNTREEAEQVQELLKKRSFTWVANRHSVDPVARRGGDLGYLTKGNMIPAFETVIFDMKPGEVSGIVRSEFGYHIIRLVGTREAQVKVELADVRERIMNQLVMRKREAAYRELIDRLYERAEVEYIDSEYPGDAPPADTARTDTTASDAPTTEG
jgi:peptidyl-prolyl cis-trans isomerase C